MPLTEWSKFLMTFITPFGRYYFHKLPSGICSAPEQASKEFSVRWMIYWCLVFGSDKAEHDTRPAAALDRILDGGVTINREKCELEKTKLLFLGHVIDHQGIQIDPRKIIAIQRLNSSNNITELRRFLGMANQMGNRAWQWSEMQEEAFRLVKAELCKPTVLAFYTPDAPTKLSTDASSHGLGAVLLQRTGGEWNGNQWRMLHDLSDTEKQYAQIKKEALATVWACDKFGSYIVGLKFHIETTDHKTP